MIARLQDVVADLVGERPAQDARHELTPRARRPLVETPIAEVPEDEAARGLHRKRDVGARSVA
jgi:hypothetical protein